MRILLVEDDDRLGQSIHRAIKCEGYACDWVQNLNDASNAVKDGVFSLIVLDWVLPDGEGTDWLKKQRSTGLGVPVIMLTARISSMDKVTGLDYGADDYLTKPFDLDEFFARIRALARRGQVKPSRAITVGKIFIDPDSLRVTVNDEIVELAKTEFYLLLILVDKKNEFISKRTLEETLYDWDSEITPNAIEVQISRLRKKIGFHYIKTRRGFGYKLEGH